MSADLTVNYDLLIGADGARSAVRDSFLSTDFFDFEQKYVPFDRKSIFLPPPDDEKQDIQLQSGCVHSWRIADGTSLLILHQPDGSMSGAIRLRRDRNQVINLSTKEEVLKFFQDNFSELGKLMPESEAEAFLNRPLTSVLTIRCSRYHYGDSVLLIGDAAHSVSPTIGQGCNAALEDVEVFDNLLDEYSDNVGEAIKQYTVRRKPDAHALVELGDNVFPLSKRLLIEFILRERFAKIRHKLFPKHFSPSIGELLFESKVSYSEILNLYKGWISKVKQSNEKKLS